MHPSNVNKRRLIGFSVSGAGKQEVADGHLVVTSRIVHQCTRGRERSNFSETSSRKYKEYCPIVCVASGI